MAFNVILYKFSKKINSTAQPNDDSGSVFSCELKEDTDTLTPTIIFKAKSDFHHHHYNYAKIDIFGRYYYITKWTFSKGFWLASMSVDTLASWKNLIGSTSQYVTRCSLSSVWNDLITDNEYIAEAFSSTVIESTNDYPFTTFVEDGCILLGIVGGGLSEVSISNFYIFTIEEFKIFSNELFSTDLISQAVYGTINPLQYITSCIWFPFSVNEIPNTQVSQIKFGNKYINIAGRIIRSNYTTRIFQFHFELSKHPQSDICGSYLNASPYTKRSFCWHPMGELPIDTQALSNSNLLYINLSVNLHTGQCCYLLDNIKTRLSTGTFMLGVNMPVAQLTTNTSSLASNAVSLGVNFATGNGVGSLSNVVNGLLNSVPQLQKTGTEGNITALTSIKPFVKSEFYNITDIDNNRFGKPVFKTHKISNLSGFIQCSNATINVANTSNFSITLPEHKEILDSMNGGFYYE